MKIFVSWSGNNSRKFAEQIKEWIPLVIQSAKPYFSPDDIDKGARWSLDIATELSSSQVGIICLTKENLHSDWILFEAGALSKAIDKSHVCPILFGINNADLSGPLKQFQTTLFNKQELLKLITLINSKLNEHKLAPKILERSFEMCWPDFESKINSILEESNNNEYDERPIRSDREILEELLDLSRKSMTRALRSTASVSSVVSNDLVEKFLQICIQQKDKVGNYQDALNLLENMKKPISIILSRNSEKNELTDNAIKKLESFEFIVNSDDDDEIPF